MADLFDRIYGNESTETPRLNVHVLTAALVLVQTGNFTSTQIKNYFNMDIDASNDFDALVTLLNNASTKVDKMEVLQKLEAVGIATEEGIYSTKTEYKNALGI